MIPHNLIGHPQGDDISQWDIYQETVGVLRSQRKSDYSYVAGEYKKDMENLIRMYDPQSQEPSNLGVGRTVVAIRQAIVDTYGDKWDKELPVVPE